MKILLVLLALFFSVSISAPIPAEQWSENVELSARSKIQHMAQAVSIAHRIRKAFRPKQNEAVFWSGSKKDKNGQMVSVHGYAKSFAQSNKKKIISQALFHHGIKIPNHKENPLSSRLWNFASKAWAVKAKGQIHAILGSKRRPGNTYDNIEKPALLKNPKVTKLIEHNADTKHETTVK